MPINLNSIKTSDATGAEADRVTLQTFIDDNNKAGDVIAKIADLKRCTAFIIPVARSAEFDAASEADKIKFCEIATKASRRSSGTFEQVFEDEYNKIFV